MMPGPGAPLGDEAERGYLTGRRSHEQGGVLDVSPRQPAPEVVLLEPLPRRGAGYDPDGSELAEQPRLAVVKRLRQLRFEPGGPGGTGARGVVGDAGVARGLAVGHHGDEK